MSSTKLNPTRALKVIPSDNCNVPTPYVLAQGVTIAIATDQLITSGAPFITNSIYNVNVGDVVYNITENSAATIVEVIDKDTLLLNADIMVNAENEFIVYQEGPITGLGNQGCILYLGGTQNVGELHITTIGGDDMVIAKINKPFFPIQVKKVWLTGTSNLDPSDIYALW